MTDPGTGDPPARAPEPEMMQSLADVIRIGWRMVRRRSWLLVLPILVIYKVTGELERYVREASEEDDMLRKSGHD